MVVVDMNLLNYNIFGAENIYLDAILQFEDCMRHPSVVRGALMPDAHLGYSMPIGGVIATDSYVFPAWCGFDIGCTDKDTEYLTRDGWKKISEYGGEEIMLYDVHNDISFFKKPNALVVKECDEFVHLNVCGVDQMLTLDHNVLMFSYRNKNKYVSKPLSDWLHKNNTLSKGVNHVFKTTFNYKTDNKLQLSDDEIRLIVAISADGHLRKSGRVEFHLKKQHKIDRLLKLLCNVNIYPNVYNLKNGNFGCSFNFYKATKDLSLFWNADAAQLEVFIDEIKYWDSHIKKDGRVTYSTSDKVNAEVVQFAYATQGIRANIFKVNYPEHKNWKPTYSVYTTNNNYVYFPNQKNINTVPSVDGKSYCFNTDTGYWVMRRNGKIVITGNCGVAAIKTSFDISVISRNAHNIHRDIMNALPTGFDVWDTVNDIPGHLNPDDLTPDGREMFESRKGFRQLGTLGGGNHFLEIGYDANDNVWITVHSGSRGIGHGIAGMYMKKAANGRKQNEGHFCFHEYSASGVDYINDMNWCLEFALENRKRMINLASDIMRNYHANGNIYCSVNLINRNHNHIEKSRGLWIHRKGATHAEDGMLGVIPGNMRDGSFIVRGKGNPESLYSSSHGAGRVLGRKQAKRVLNVSDFSDTMENVVANVNESTLDESPFAYKNIYKVMLDQSDLVDVIAHVRPIINIKG
jgi:tRNA-splicing ligase RtcB